MFNQLELFKKSKRTRKKFTYSTLNKWLKSKFSVPCKNICIGKYIENTWHPSIILGCMILKIKFLISKKIGKDEIANLSWATSCVLQQLIKISNLSTTNYHLNRLIFFEFLKVYIKSRKVSNFGPWEMSVKMYFLNGCFKSI